MLHNNVMPILLSYKMSPKLQNSRNSIIIIRLLKHSTVHLANPNSG